MAEWLLTMLLAIFVILLIILGGAIVYKRLSRRRRYYPDSYENRPTARATPSQPASPERATPVVVNGGLPLKASMNPSRVRAIEFPGTPDQPRYRVILESSDIEGLTVGGSVFIANEIQRPSATQPPTTSEEHRIENRVETMLEELIEMSRKKYPEPQPMEKSSTEEFNAGFDNMVRVRKELPQTPKGTQKVTIKQPYSNPTATSPTSKNYRECSKCHKMRHTLNKDPVYVCIICQGGNLPRRRLTRNNEMERKIIKDV